MWAKQTGYTLHYIKNAKHFANGDNPKQVNREIEHFIESINNHYIDTLHGAVHEKE